MNWFKKMLVSMFSSEEDEPEQPSHEKQYYYGKDIETKVAYKYPKGNFRFPLISDEDLSRKQEKREMRRPPIQKKEMKQITPKKPEKIVKEKDKRPFSPTKIPSPIYGFKDRNENIIQEEKEIVEFELPGENEFVNIAEHNIQQAEVAVTLHEEEEIVEEMSREDTNSQNSYEEIHMEYSNEIKDSEKSLDEPKDREPQAIEKHQNESSSEKRNLIPYNVIMLKQDKRRKQNPGKDVEQRNEGSYRFPNHELLLNPPKGHNEDSEWIEMQKQLLDETFENFNVRASVVNVTQGPAVTRFEVHPEPGVKVNKVTNLTDDIKLSLAAKDIRIEAPIPGKNTIGIEVPNRHSKPVMLKEIIQSSVFKSSPSPLTVALGLDIAGKPVVTDLRKMPHGLIAGATGSGKSVCINAMLISLLYKASPHQVKLMLIDPKVVELAPYNHIPHLVSPVITDVKAATAALKWAVEEMERRYESFAHAGVRDITRYNELAKLHGNLSAELPYLVIVIDELADLMMVAPSDVEEAICRIAQKARACGIHLIIATQRPSVDVITGLIKANIPTRIAFSVSSQVDSRTIIDMSGAERLLGKGDMLFLENGSSKPFRVQGNFVSDEEIERIVTHVKGEMKPSYLFEQQDLLKKNSVAAEEDELFYDACEFIIQQGAASTSGLQRNFRIGYNRAARLMDMMEEQGIISESRGSKPRDVLMTEDEFVNSIQ